MYAACLESFIFLSRYKYKRVHVPLFHSLRVSFRNGRWHFIIITLLSFVVMFEIANYLLRILAYKFIWPWRLSYGLKKIETLPGVSPPLSVFLKLKNDSFRRYIYIEIQKVSYSCQSDSCISRCDSHFKYNFNRLHRSRSKIRSYVFLYTGFVDLDPRSCSQY